MTTELLTAERWVRVRDVAEHLDVSESFVQHAVAAGTIPVHRVGRSVRFKLSEIDAWVEARTDQ